MEHDEPERDMDTLIIAHGEQKINNMPEGQVCKLQRDIMKGKGKMEN
jgi:hypothetical protein